MSNTKTQNNMKTRFLQAITIAAVSWHSVKAQFSFSDIKFWVGTGPDSAALVVDFHDGTWDSCYAWGFRFNGNATGEDMLNAIAAADVNFSVNISGGFLMDIAYGVHAGVGGTNNFYWGTWSGPDLNSLSMNMGLSTPLSHADWFACSFTDFNPPLPPGTPIPAFEPFRFTAQDVVYWIGSGPDTSMLIIDFLDGSGQSSFAWGYLHNGPVTAETMLQEVAGADPSLNIAIAGGFLNDITYQSFAGIGGSPNYWATWSAVNLGNWNLNMGLAILVGNGDIFGCTYTNFNPPVRPDYPQPALPSSAAPDHTPGISLKIYPNPAADVLFVNYSTPPESDAFMRIKNVTGKEVMFTRVSAFPASVSLNTLTPGCYFITLQNAGESYSAPFVKL